MNIFVFPAERKREPESIATDWEYGFRVLRAALARNDNGGDETL